MAQQSSALTTEAFGARHVGYFFAFLIVLFAIGAVVYLWLNDFARETLDVVFPAIGAILLSAYLVVKTVWLDAPEAHGSRVPIAVLSDPSTGAVYSMIVPRATDPVEQFSDFAGIRELDSLTLYKDFADLHLRDRLKAVDSADTTVERQILTDLVEYTILDWLAKPENSVGWDDIGTIHMLQGSVGGGGLPGLRQPVPVSLGPSEYNDLVRKRPPSLLLPPGSTVIRRGEPERTIEVRTPHSLLRIVLGMRGKSQFQNSPDPAASKLWRTLGLTSAGPPAWVTAFMTKLETRQAPVRRFSQQAKLEAVWLDRVHARFETDFSWELLRKRLYQSQ